MTVLAIKPKGCKLYQSVLCFNPFPNDKNLDISKLKKFADDDFQIL